MNSSPGRLAALAATAAAAATATVVVVKAVPALLGATRGLPTAIGARPRQLRAAATGNGTSTGGTSATYDGTEFHNRMPSSLLSPSGTFGILRAFAAKGDAGLPPGPVTMATPDFGKPAAPLAATWLGHASVLLEVDGRRVLADPVWSERVSPSPTVGPRRLHPLPFDPATLPDLDAIVISHDHYDHLDVATVQSLTASTTAPFLVPLGVGAHLRGWGVPVDRVIELDWDEAAEVAGLTIVCTEARHFSGRGIRRNTTLWSSWAVLGPEHRVYFGGDTGYTPAFAGIGARYGPFDLTVLPIGAYGDAWPDIHMNPEEAVKAHGDLGGKVLLPIHWATFDLAFHSWSEPAERLTTAAQEHDVRLALPLPGGRVEVSGSEPVTSEPWWRSVG